MCYTIETRNINRIVWYNAIAMPLIDWWSMITNYNDAFTLNTFNAALILIKNLIVIINVNTFHYKLFPLKPIFAWYESICPIYAIQNNRSFSSKPTNQNSIIACLLFYCYLMCHHAHMWTHTHEGIVFDCVVVSVSLVSHSLVDPI